MDSPITLATRKSPLALKQTELTVQFLKSHFPDREFAILPLSTTGDQQQNWSLQQQGGKGLFTKELEEALLDGRAHIAVHSAKDLPTELPKGLEIGGYLPRATPNDVLVRHKGSPTPKTIATGSPRRQAQLKRLFPEAEFSEIRGSVQTRMEKIAQKRLADATMLAAAGLERLGVNSFPDLIFERVPLKDCVPSVGQAAIALEMQANAHPKIRDVLCKQTASAINLERAFLMALGGGCHVAYAGHVEGNTFHVFHESIGYRSYSIETIEQFDLDAVLNDINHG